MTVLSGIFFVLFVFFVVNKEQLELLQIFFFNHEEHEEHEGTPSKNFSENFVVKMSLVEALSRRAS
jgi:hypothetical protein